MLKKYEYFFFSLVNTGKDGRILYYGAEQLNGDVYFNPVMSKLGFDGWELISVIPLTSSETKNMALIPIYADTIVSMTYTSGEVFYFKREITNDIKVEDLHYSEEYKYLEKLDKNFWEIEQIAKKTGALSAESLKEKYLGAGYVLAFDHKDRLIFEKNMESERFDRDKINNIWFKHS